MMCTYVVHYSIDKVQRADAGEYRCTLSISNEIKKSQPVVLEVEGEF